MLLSHTDPANPGLSRGSPGAVASHTATAGPSPLRANGLLGVLCVSFCLSFPRPALLHRRADQLLNQWFDARSREWYEKATFLVLGDRGRALALFISVQKKHGTRVETRGHEARKSRRLHFSPGQIPPGFQPQQHSPSPALSLQSPRSFGNPSSTSTDGTATWLHRPSHHDGYLLLRRAYLQVGRIFAWLLAPTSLPDDNLETAATASDQHASKKKTIFVLLSPSELNARHFPSGHNVADQSTLLGPIIADAHSMTILRRGASKSGCAARLLNALNAFFQASGGKCSSLTQLVVAIPSSGARSAELVMGSRGLYRHHYYRLRGKAYCALGISSPSGRRTPDECRPASSLAAVNPASPAEWSTLHDFLFFLLSDGEGIGAPHSAGFLGTEA